MNSFGTLFHDKIFSLTFPWLLTTSLILPWHVPNSLTFPGFPDKWSPCLNGNPSQSYEASPALWDKTVLHATWHRWMHPTLTPAKQAGTQFTYPELGTELAFVVGNILIWFRPTCTQTAIHPGSNYLTATHPEVKLMTSWVLIVRLMS